MESVPIFICCVLPVAIVLIVSLTKMNSDNKRAAILMKAIEANHGVDTDKLAEALQKPKRTAREILYRRLLWGCVCSFLGVAGIFFGVYLQYTLPGINLQIFAYLPAIAFLAIGLGFLTTYFVTKRQVTKSDEDL